MFRKKPKFFLLLFLGCFLFSGCFLFKKKCDCPTFNKRNSEKIYHARKNTDNGKPLRLPS